MRSETLITYADEYEDNADAYAQLAEFYADYISAYTTVFLTHIYLTV